MDAFPERDQSFIAEDDAIDDDSSSEYEAVSSTNTVPEPEEIIVGQQSGTQSNTVAPMNENANANILPLKSRDYQLEMVEKSMESNIIVAMDTGSGKTHIAILRVKKELERSPSDAYAWFLAPTGVLCEQQSSNFRTHMPAAQVRYLTGAERELWSERCIWDAALKNIRVVVSTYQVLLDGLSNGFVHLSTIPILVFDEAHNCIRDGPANVIMSDFYHPARNNGKKVPHILGLTASPVINSKPQGLQKIEANLNALSRTPKVHADELRSYVHQPRLEILEYRSDIGQFTAAPVLDELLKTFNQLDISKDPYVLDLQGKSDPQSQQKLQEAFMKRRTYCRDQLNSLCTKAMHIFSELGPWAADFYILSVASKLRASVAADVETFLGWSNREKEFLIGVLNDVQAHSTATGMQRNLENGLSSKLSSFIDLLIAENADDFTGLVFVEQRAAVAVLAEILSTHPRTKNITRCGTFVGNSLSSKSKKKKMGELLDSRDQRTSLDDLRSGKKNLIIATSVLEEGVDIPACHIVICFSQPQNLKAFIQRRGRARRMKSKFVVMVEENDAVTKSRDWESLEADMKRAYMDETRELDDRRERDAQDEEYAARFEIESTGALLTPNNAVPHLHHFCAVLPADPYVDCRPEFMFSESHLGFSATVVLPTAVSPELRRFKSRRSWKTEGAARKDACFEAMRALFEAKLINDHLLPLHRYESAQTLRGEIHNRPAVVTVSSVLNPWVDMACASADWETAHCTVVTIHADGQVLVSMDMLLPVKPPLPPDFNIYWEFGTRWTVSSKRSSSHTPRSLFAGRSEEITELLYQSAHPFRLKENQRDFVVQFAPVIEQSEIAAWIASSKGCQAAADLYGTSTKAYLDYGLIHPNKQCRPAFMFKGWCMRNSELKDTETEVKYTSNDKKLHVEAVRWPKRAVMLLPILKQESVLPQVRVDHLLATEFTVENLPLRFSQFAHCIPSILHRYEMYLIAEQLGMTVLAPVNFGSLTLILTAISASVAQEENNYQRLEFLGDSVLKMCTSVQLMGHHANWHEGYLSARKDGIVANSRLARAALDKGLDSFILTKQFTGRRWKPAYRSDLPDTEGSERTRSMSTKVLADVVEALIGAAYLDGGVDKALACMRVFLPELSWDPLTVQHDRLYELVPSSVQFPVEFEELETMIGYKFDKKALLLEAMTHSSYKMETNVVSYQRLEFLGDSMLDQLVVILLYDIKPEIPHYDMHLMRTVLVNADFLAFLCLESTIFQPRFDIILDPSAENGVRPVENQVEHHLWQFMRHASSIVPYSQQACEKRYLTLRDSIRHALEHGQRYPWRLLSQVGAEKFFSDLIESVLGAIYIDSKGDRQACLRFLENLGLMKYLRRITDSYFNDDDNGGIVGHEQEMHIGGKEKKRKRIQLMHPKQELGNLVMGDGLKYVVSIDVESGSNPVSYDFDLNGNGRENTDPTTSTTTASSGSSSSTNAKKSFQCRLQIAERDFVYVRGGLSKEHIMTVAAEKAIELFLLNRHHRPLQHQPAERDEEQDSDKEERDPKRAKNKGEIGDMRTDDSTVL